MRASDMHGQAHVSTLTWRARRAQCSGRAGGGSAGNFADAVRRKGRCACRVSAGSVDGHEQWVHTSYTSRASPDLASRRVRATYLHMSVEINRTKWLSREGSTRCTSRLFSNYLGITRIDLSQPRFTYYAPPLA